MNCGHRSDSVAERQRGHGLWLDALRSLAWGSLCLLGMVAHARLALRNDFLASWFQSLAWYAPAPTVVLSACVYSRARVPWWTFMIASVGVGLAELAWRADSDYSLLHRAMAVVATPAFVLSACGGGVLIASVVCALCKCGTRAQSRVRAICASIGGFVGIGLLFVPSSDSSPGFFVYVMSAFVALDTAVCYAAIWIAETQARWRRSRRQRPAEAGP